MSNLSPFTLNRFEYESRHLYYLQKDLFEKLEIPKPIYLVGSRGTGKTTLLKALNWEERKNNPSLINQFENDSTHGKYVGVYLKLPEIQFDLLRRWLSLNESDYAIIFAFFLDLVWLEELIDALSELIVNGTFNVSATDERVCIKTIMENFENNFSSIGAQPLTLKGLSKTIRNIREEIEIASRRKESPHEIIERYRIVGQVGDFGRKLGGLLQPLCISNAEGNSSSKDWYFKICMDEGECLDPYQQRILNTMLRISTTPVFLVVSYVSMPSDSSVTLLPNITLQSADRELILLDNIDEKDFLELAEGVATIRSRTRSGNNTVSFSAQKTLGKLDINHLLYLIVSESVSPKAKRLLDAAQNLAKTPYFANKERNATSPPIFESYLNERLNITTPLAEEQAWERRKKTSADYRKKMVAAYLSICSDIDTEVRYAYADMVLQMSDMCIRDFLHQLDIIFMNSNWDLDKFLTNQVPIKIQNNAIKTASKEKYLSIPKSGVSEPSTVGNMIDVLARLTSLIQSKSFDSSHLKTTERGIFVICKESDSNDTHEEYIFKLIKDAAEAGFLRITSQDKDEMRFRVHTSLAAYYGFSYRGAYYPVPLDWKNINDIQASENDSGRKKTADSIARSFDKPSQENLSLFGGDLND